MAQADLDACASIDTIKHGLGNNVLPQQLESMVDGILLENGPAQTWPGGKSIGILTLALCKLRCVL